MRQLLIVIGLLFTVQQNAHSKQIPVIRAALGLGCGAISVASGAITYIASSNTNDSAVGLNLVVAPITGTIAVGSGFASYKILKSAAKSMGYRNTSIGLINLFKRFW